ncbi:DEAD/DEAH box helicase [Methylobacterium platani]|uniref:DEAD-box ATP-dependent RNA helicase RhpA n=2 Tax=Methylobacterium platani TaxID=427683 RepID=A0A179S0A6_9HYPH|nr:DEAD/DEAH box helicase [Methylobacterium platani]KMO13104.1 DEAD/DEAH box helicase [Methylobacterium platani JCM 14648]OAS18559.1 DEAD/DEAH box helicase [Methylobacterium platani]
MSFAELGLSEKVQQAVEAAGYTTPTPIQAQAIPHVLARRDVLGVAQTGTGKTAAFTLPMLTLLEQGRARARMPRTLILEPTRELAAQVEENFERYGSNHKLNVALLIGGVSFADQDLKITRGVDVLIATPGRLLDHFERGKLLLTGVELLVIDEADRMLDMGFIPDIERIVKMVPFTRQTLFFSATMPPEIQRLADDFLHNPVRIEVARPASTAATITQRLVATGAEGHQKRKTLRKLIRAAEELNNGIIFCNRKRDVAQLQKSLSNHGFNVAALHGDMDQRARMAALDAFRSGEVPLLVASDVAARGLDIPAVSHVFNFDVPHHAEDYVHRIGRTGRAGRTGTALTLIGRGDEKSLAAIETLIGQPIAWADGDLASLPEDEPGEATERRGRGGRGRRDEGRRQDGRQAQGGKDRGGRDEGGSSEGRRDETRRRRASRNARSEETAPSPRNGEAPRVREDRRPVQEERRPQDERAPARRNDRGRHRDDDAMPEAEIGMGAHVPAFLLRPVVLKKRTEGE